MTKNTQHAEIYARFECDTKVTAEDVNDEESLETEYEDGDCTEESIDQDSPKTEHQIQVNSCPWLVG